MYYILKIPFGSEGKKLPAISLNIAFIKRKIEVFYKFIGGNGPSGFDPSQKLNLRDYLIF